MPVLDYFGRKAISLHKVEKLLDKNKMDGVSYLKEATNDKEADV